MSEDYIVQQQPSAAPYALGGAVVGGGTAAALSNWGPQWAREKGKYASFEDILKESKDDFVKNNEGISEKAVTDLETARTAINKAGTDYETQLNKYIVDKRNTILPADAKELTELNEAKSKLNAKINELGATEYTKKDIKTERDAVAKAQRAVRKKETELLKEAFEKSNGTRDDAIKKATEEQKGKICDELKALFEKGKIKGGKLAWITAAGVGAGALIGLMFKPKNETV